MKRALAVVALCATAAMAAEMNGMGDGEDLHQSMMQGSQQMQSMPMSGDLDRDFVEAMALHHRHGIEMAQIELNKGKDSKAKAFARKVIDAQKKELEQFERWLSEHPKKESR